MRLLLQSGGGRSESHRIGRRPNGREQKPGRVLDFEILLVKEIMARFFWKIASNVGRNHRLTQAPIPIKGVNVPCEVGQSLSHELTCPCLPDLVEC